MLQKLLKIHRYPEYAKLIIWYYLTPMLLKLKGINLGEGVKFYGMPIVSKVGNSKITIGDRVTICSKSEYTALGVNHPTIIRTLRSDAAITIGADSGISGAALCAASEIHIGKGCLLGANVTVIDNDFHPLMEKIRRYNNNLDDIATLPVTIKDNVFIGTGAIIMKGVTIHENSVIGAGAVVTQDVPPNVIYAGNPAKEISLI